MATYDYMTSLKNSGRKVQVESAKRDGDGKNIANNYAKQNGYYQDLTAGLADNLTPYSEQSGATDTTPFVFQSSGGSSDIGSIAYLKALRGNTVVFNQRIKDFSTPNYWSVTTGTLSNISNTESVFTLSGDAQYNSGITVYNSTIVGHKYLLLATLKTSVNNATLTFRQDDTLSPALHPTTEYKTYSWIHTGIGKTRMFCLVLSSGTTGDTMTAKNCMCIDLTKMFGAGNEPTTVAEFNRLFPEPYYAYNEGTLLSCKVNGYKTVGYNAFDGELEGGTISDTTGLNTVNANTFRTKNYIKVISSQQYSLEYNRADLGGYEYIYEYDENKNFIQRSSAISSTPEIITLTSQTQYIRLAYYKGSSGWSSNIPTNANICIHLTWDGTRTGYEPYETHTYPMPNVELKSAGSVYDELKPDGTLIRRIGVVDLGTLNWSYNSNGWFATSISDGYHSPTNNVVCAKYGTLDFNTGFGTNDKVIKWLGYEAVLIKDTTAGTDAAAFKTAMSGVLLYYELAEPTEEIVTGYQEITPIDDWGTQEFLYDDTIDIPVPQGNEFFYPVDYKAFMDSLGGRDDIEFDAGQIVSLTQLNNFLKTITGYDATKTQSLKNVSGTIQWVTEE